MRPFQKRESCLFAVALVAAGAAAVFEIQAAPGEERPMTVSRAITAVSPDWSTFVQISENGDGTALTNVGAWISPTVFLGVAIFDATGYTVSAEFQPGLSGKGTGFGSGHFELEGVFGFDLITFLFVGPYDVSVDLAVADATDAGAFVYQGVTTEHNPLTGETRIVRQHVLGNQASGDTAGSLSVMVDGSLVTETTEGWGMVTVNTVHDVDQLH